MNLSDRGKVFQHQFIGDFIRRHYDKGIAFAVNRLFMMLNVGAQRAAKPSAAVTGWAACCVPDALAALTAAQRCE